MALNEEYTNDRLDRLASDIRDEAASRREETSELRMELMNEICALRKEHSKDSNWVLCCALFVSLLLFLLSLPADDADAAAQARPRPTTSKSASVLVPTKKFIRVGVRVPMEGRTDQRFDDLNRKIHDGSSRTAEDLRQLRRHMKAGFEELDDDTRTRELLLFWFALLIAFWLWFCIAMIKL